MESARARAGCRGTRPAPCRVRRGDRIGAARLGRRRIEIPHAERSPRPSSAMKFSRKLPSGMSPSFLSVSYCLCPPCGLPKSANRPRTSPSALPRLQRRLGERIVGGGVEGHEPVLVERRGAHLLLRAPAEEIAADPDHRVIALERPARAVERHEEVRALQVELPHRIAVVVGAPADEVAGRSRSSCHWTRGGRETRRRVAGR